ncbi:MAG: MFS transporter [Deltaproteobacteria bacterium]|nr:MFS transporter [Deltaproteobacteria bacterium]
MKSEPAESGYHISKKYSYYVFALLFLLYMFDYIDRMVIASLFPFLKSDWGLTDTQCCLLVAAVSWSIVAFTFPVSVAVDRWSRKKCIGIMAVLWSLATAACAFTTNFFQLFVSRVFIGLGEAGYAPGGTAMISALFPEEKRAKVMGIWNASIPLGAALGVALGGIIAERFGWRHAFGLVALPGLLVAVLFFWVKDYKNVDLIRTSGPSDRPEAQTSLRFADIAREFLQTRSLILTYLGFAGNLFATAALLAWLPTYFHRMQGLSVSEAGTKGGLVMLMAIVGAPLGGFLADRWYQVDPRGRLRFASLVSSLAFVAFLSAFSMPGHASAFPIMCLGGVMAAAFVPAAAAVTQDVVHPGLRAVSYSLCVIVQQVLGTALGPIFVGVISDHYGIGAAFLVLPFSFVVAATFYFLGSFYYERDLEKVERVTLVFEQ